MRKQKSPLVPKRNTRSNAQGMRNSNSEDEESSESVNSSPNKYGNSSKSEISFGQNSLGPSPSSSDSSSYNKRDKWSPEPYGSRSDSSFESSSSLNVSKNNMNILYPDLSKDCTRQSLHPKQDDVKSPYGKAQEMLDVQRHRNVKKSDSEKEESFSDRHVERQRSTKSRMTLEQKIFVIVSVIVLLIGCYLLSTPDKTTNSIVSPFEKFLSEISQLKDTFPGQNKRLWRTVQASVKHVLNEIDSDYPVVILMASQAQHASTANCIAHKITTAFKSSLNLDSKVSNFDINNIKDLYPDQQKINLDYALKSALSSEHERSFILKNLQVLSPQAALLLHGYCDNDNAPYKNVMIVLTLHEDELKVRFDPDDPNTVEGFLDKLWTAGLDSDKVKAIMSRVANNIVIVKPEDNHSVITGCG